MELAAEHVPRAATDDELAAVVADRDGVLAALGREGVHVVVGRASPRLGRQRRRALEADGVPADVRQLQALGAQRHDPAAQQAEALGAAELLGALEEQVHPQAQPDDRHARGRALAHERVEAAVAQPPHRLRQRADAGQHEAVGRREHLDVGGQQRLGADALEGLLDRAAVAHAVVDDPDHSVSVPLVDGTPSRSDRSRGDAQRARERLEGRLDQVVGVRAGLHVEVQRQPRRVGDRAQELLGQLVVERRRSRRPAGRPRTP